MNAPIEERDRLRAELDALRRETLRRLEVMLTDGAWSERLGTDGPYVIRFATETDHAHGNALTEAIDAAWAMREIDDE